GAGTAALRPPGRDAARGSAGAGERCAPAAPSTRTARRVAGRSRPSARGAAVLPAASARPAAAVGGAAVPPAAPRTAAVEPGAPPSGPAGAGPVPRLVPRGRARPASPLREIGRASGRERGWGESGG